MINNYNDFKTWANAAKSFISKTHFSLCNEHEDGRTNSTIDEDIILDLLMERYGEEVLYRSPARKWFDVWHIPSGTPINIKTTSMKGSDNACNFLALLWCFTDLEIDKARAANKSKDWKQLLDFLGKNSIFESDSRDYWFFVVDKGDTSNVVVNSLKRLPSPSGNPSNPPFQVNWKNNKKQEKRTFKEACDLYVGICVSNIEKRHKSDMLDEAKSILEGVSR